MPPARPSPRPTWRRLHSILALTFVVVASACERDLVRPDAVPAAVADGPSAYRLAPVANYTSVSVGKYHNCAVRSDGIVECWGYNGDGRAPASKVASSGSFVSVSAGDRHSCALRADGVAECWGYQADGSAPATRAASVGGQYFTKLGLGADHSCALVNTGVIECWGYNSSGQAPASRASSNGQPFVDLDAGFSHTCALRLDGIVQCWGYNGDGRAPATRAPSAGGQKFIALSGGYAQTCAVREDGVIECWGLNNFGQSPATRASTSGLKYTAVSAGYIADCALREDGVIECWGGDADGEGPALRASIDASRKFTSVGLFERHTCALRDDGAIECWGDNGDAKAPALRAIAGAVILPTATFAYPTSVASGTDITLSLTDAEVPGYPAATSFSYAFDCGDGSGYGAFGSSNTIDCPSSLVGSRAVKGKVKDQDGDVTQYTGTVEVTAIYSFAGFEAPVDNAPLVNVAKAGQAIPLKWRLLDGSGSPVLGLSASDVVLAVVAMSCQSGVATSVVEAGNTSGGSGLQSLGDGYYQMNWSTQRGFAGTCKTLRLVVAGAEAQEAHFQFTR